jgi:hypothetical protein
MYKQNRTSLKHYVKYSRYAMKNQQEIVKAVYRRTGTKNRLPGGTDRIPSFPYNRKNSDGRMAI